MGVSEDCQMPLRPFEKSLRQSRWHGEDPGREYDIAHGPISPETENVKISKSTTKVINSERKFWVAHAAIDLLGALGSFYYFFHLISILTCRPT